MNPTILTFPTLTANPSKVDWKLNRFDARNTSPLSGTFQDIQRPGANWSCTMSWNVLSYSDSQALASWADQMSQGGARTYLPNFAYQPRGAGVFVGAINGANQTGTSLILNGLTASSLIAQPGDFFNVTSGTQHQLLRVTAMAASDGAGNLTVNFVPALRFSPTNGAPVTFGIPAMLNAPIYKSDWQGNQLQYSTPRTNYSLRSEDFSQTSYRSMTAGVVTAAATSIAPGGATLKYTWSGGYFINSDISGFNGTSETTFSSIVEIITSINTYLTIYDQTTSTNVAQIQLVPSTGIVTATIGSPTFTVTNMGTGPNGGTLFRLSISASGLNPAHSYYGFWTQNSASSIIFHAEQTELGLTSTSFIQTTTSPVTVTDYTLTASQITFAHAPASSAALTLKNGSSSYQFGTGNGAQTLFDTGLPLVAFAFAKPDSSISYTAPRIAALSLSLMEDIQL